MPKAHSFVSGLIAHLLRLLAFTWRVRLEDSSGLSKEKRPPVPPVIWVLWHNRILIVPIMYERLFRSRKGAALISRSRDGGLLASCIARFGGESVRGSTSRGGSSALADMKRRIEDGYDIYITPDGPRGPRYHLGGGAIWHAQSSGAPIVPENVEFSSVWRLGRWDGFNIPKPFSKVTITLQALHTVRDTASESEFEDERERLHDLMMSGTSLR